MARKEIPAKHILVCDRCGHEGERGYEAFARGGTHSIAVESWAIGYDGAAGGHTRPLDLCASCTTDFERFMNQLRNHKP